MKPQRIKTLEELMKCTADKKPHHFVITLNYGLTSKKIIRRVMDMFYVHNCIDNSDQQIHKDDLMEDEMSNIGNAMRMGAFYMV